MSNFTSSQLPANRKVMLVPLCQNETFKTDGTTAYLGTILSLPELDNIGPLIEQVRVHWDGLDFTTNFQARVAISTSVTGVVWTTPAAIITAQAASGQVIGTAYTTATSFGPNVRFSIEVSNESGAAIESGRITAYLEVVLKT